MKKNLNTLSKKSLKSNKKRNIKSESSPSKKPILRNHSDIDLVGS